MQRSWKNWREEYESPDRSIFAILILVTSVAHAENWPQWRGPRLNGVSGEKNLPFRWSADENVSLEARDAQLDRRHSDHLGRPHLSECRRWRRSVTFGASTAPKASLVWKKLLGSGNVKMRKQNMSSPSPVTDGKSVCVMTGTGILKAFDFNGKELWARDIQKDYGAFRLNWGYASSPLLTTKTALFVQVLHGMKTDDPSYVLRIDKKTGKTLWKVERPTQRDQRIA